MVKVVRPVHILVSQVVEVVSVKEEVQYQRQKVDIVLEPLQSLLFQDALVHQVALHYLSAMLPIS